MCKQTNGAIKKWMKRMRDIGKIIQDLEQREAEDTQKATRLRKIVSMWHEEGFISAESEAWLEKLHRKSKREGQKISTTPFLRFAQAQRLVLRDTMPFIELGRAIGQKWNNLSQQERKKWHNS